MRIYLAAPYGDHNPDDVIAENVARADAMARELVLQGHVVFCPIKMTWGWQKDTRLRPEHWWRIDMDMLEHWAEAIYRMPGVSPGCEREVKRAKELGLVILGQGLMGET